MGGLFTREIERNEFADDAWWWGGGRNTGCVKGGLPLVLTLDASRILQQVAETQNKTHTFSTQDTQFGMIYSAKIRDGTWNRLLAAV